MPLSFWNVMISILSPDMHTGLSNWNQQIKQSSWPKSHSNISNKVLWYSTKQLLMYDKDVYWFESEISHYWMLWFSSSPRHAQSQDGASETSKPNNLPGQTHSPTHRPLSAHHCVLVGQGPLPQRTIYFNQPLSTYVHNDEIGRKLAIADDIYHYPE